MPWLLNLFASYLIFGCFYYVAAIPRLASLIMKMKEYDRSVAAGVTLFIFLMTLGLLWPFYIYLDIKGGHFNDCTLD